MPRRRKAKARPSSNDAANNSVPHTQHDSAEDCLVDDENGIVLSTTPQRAKPTFPIDTTDTFVLNKSSKLPPAMDLKRSEVMAWSRAPITTSANSASKESEPPSLDLEQSTEIPTVSLLQAPDRHTEPVIMSMLRRICGMTEQDGALEAVTDLSVVVDTRDGQPCDEIGELLPMLEMLQLRSSSLASIRDLGTSLKHLRVLRASRCGLRELDGLGALPVLEELYVAFNDIWDLSSVALHEHLQVLDLESNAVDETLQVAQLATCPVLWSLTLEGNPLRRRCASLAEYRRVVCQHLPTLVCFDDEPVNAADQQPCDSPNVAELYRSAAPLAFINEASPVHSDAGDTSFRNTALLSPNSAAPPPFTFNRSLLDDKESQLVSASIKRFRPHGDGFAGDLVRNEAGSVPNNSAAVSPTTRKEGDRGVEEKLQTSSGRRLEMTSQEKVSDDEVLSTLQDTERHEKGPDDGDGVDTEGVFEGSCVEERAVTRVSSALTHGAHVVLVGNVARGLRSRQQHRLGPLRQSSSSSMEGGLDAGETEILQELRAVKISDALEAADDTHATTNHGDGSGGGASAQRSLTDLATPLHLDEVTTAINQLKQRAAGSYLNSPRSQSSSSSRLSSPRSSTPSTASSSSRPSSNQSSSSAGRTYTFEGMEEHDAGTPSTLNTLDLRGRKIEESAASHSNHGEFGGNGGTGPANHMEDREVVQMLRLRPKNVPQLRTRADFQRFFHGMEQAKLKRLLEEAYSHLDPVVSSAKINKRLQLFWTLDGPSPDGKR